MRWKTDSAQGTKKRSCLKCAYDPRKKLCIIQWSEFMSNQIMKVDKIDKTLDYLRLRWHRNVGCENNLSQSREYALISVESIQGVVHFAERNFGLLVSTCPALRRYVIQKEDASDVGWLSEMFYVNHFYKYCSPSQE